MLESVNDRIGRFQQRVVEDKEGVLTGATTSEASHSGRAKFLKAGPVNGVTFGAIKGLGPYATSDDSDFVLEWDVEPGHFGKPGGSMANPNFEFRFPGKLGVGDIRPEFTLREFDRDAAVV